jgi:hypothetical protein
MTDTEAAERILQYIGDVDECVAGLTFETFSEKHFMQALTERAVQVSSQLLKLLPAASIGPTGIMQLDNMAGRIALLGEPVSAEVLWGAVTELFPAIEKALKAAR